MRPATATMVTAVILLAGCGEKGESEVTAPRSATSTATTAAPENLGGPGERPAGGRERPRRSTGRAAARRREAERVVRAYLQALDARDGAAVCRLLIPGAIDELRLPRRRASCSASLKASIGYRDPRGLPQFAGVSLAQLVSTRAKARTARVTATVVTTFADRDEPSIEDDIVYLERRGGDYLIAKPSTALYRAVGAEPPLRSVIPPG